MKIEDLKKIAGMIPDDLKESFEQMMKNPASEEEIALFKKMQEIETRKANLPEPEFTKAKRAEPIIDESEMIIYKGEEYFRAYADELDKFANKYPKSVPLPEKKYAKYSDVDMVIAVKTGANWRKQQMINKGAEWLRNCLDNGTWVDQFLSEKDKEAIVLTYKENMEEEFKL